jgi:hypothetical protein
MVISGGLETVTALKCKSMSQGSLDHMTIMRMQKALTAAHKKLDISIKALHEMELPPMSSSSR